MQSSFAIHDIVHFGTEEWTVVKYLKEAGRWFVLFRNLTNGATKAVATAKLEEYL